MDLAKQIERDLRARLTRKRLKNAEMKVLNEMDEIKNRKTKSGQSPAVGGRYNNVYSRQYAKRVKNGRRSPVTLRRTPASKSIENTRVVGKKDRSELQFRDRDKGVIFNYHQTGTAKGGKYRQIYPTRDKEVPKALDEIAENAVFKILNG